MIGLVGSPGPLHAGRLDLDAAAREVAGSFKAVARFKDRVRELTRRHRGVSLERMIADLNPLLRGWAGYFGFSQLHEGASRLRPISGHRDELHCLLDRWSRWVWS